MNGFAMRIFKIRRWSILTMVLTLILITFSAVVENDTTTSLRLCLGLKKAPPSHSLSGLPPL
ncbi:hypothetical protein [Marine gokushovirus]|nr:hypothetical protein [Marine gokushovirus]